MSSSELPATPDRDGEFVGPECSTREIGQLAVAVDPVQTVKEAIVTRWQEYRLRDLGMAGVAGVAMSMLIPGVAHADRDVKTVIHNEGGGSITFCQGDGGFFGGGSSVCKEPSTVGSGGSLTVASGNAVHARLSPKTQLVSPGGDPVARNCWGRATETVRVNLSSAVGVVKPVPGGGFQSVGHLDVSSAPCRKTTPAPKWNVGPAKKAPTTPKNTTKSDECPPGLLGDFCRGARNEGPSTSKSDKTTSKKAKKPTSFWEKLGDGFKQSESDKRRGEERRRGVGMISLGAMQLEFTMSDGRQVIGS